MTRRRVAVRFLQWLGILALTLLRVSGADPADQRSHAPGRLDNPSQTSRAVTPAPALPRANRTVKATSARPEALFAQQKPVARREVGRDRDDAVEREHTGPNGRPLPGTDYPGEAMRFRNLSLRDERGNIPIDGPLKARAHVRLMQEAGATQRLQHLESSAGLSPSWWTWLGPGNIGGRVRTIAIHPTTPATMFAGSVGGGIWKTTNTGASWAPVDDFLADLAVSSIVFNPASPNVIYAGTGEGFYNVDGIRGAGIFKSVDGGKTWSQLAATNNVRFSYVNRVAISPNGSTVLAATRTGLFRSADAGVTLPPVLASEIGYGVTDVAFNPSDSTKAVASGFDGNAWYSTNGGATWTAASGLPGAAFSFRRVEIAYAPSAPSVVYASVDLTGGTIYVSTNGGVSYSQVSNPSVHYLGSQGWYGNALWVNPVDPNSIVVGGIDLFRSTNGGATISRISAWYNAPLSDHADHHVIVSPPGFDNTTSKTFFSGDDGGVYKAADWSTVGGGGASDCSAVSPFSCAPGWTSLNNNLGVTQFFGGSGHAGTGRILGGTQDNGTLVYNGNAQAWTTEFGGDGGFAAVDPTNANTLYGEYKFLSLHRSLTGNSAGSDWINGLFWTGSTYVCKPAPYTIPDVCSSGDIAGQANFIAPFVLDPNTPMRLLAGGWSLWRTNDAITPNTSSSASGPSWASIKSPDTDRTMISPISAIAVAKGNSDIVWAGHNNGGVFKTTTGTSATPAWTKVDIGSTPLPNRFVTRLTIDPINSNIVYATFGGFCPDNVYRTIDGGTTWASITGIGLTALPASPVRDLQILPTNSAWLYAATDAGVFASGDSGATWGPPTMSPTDGPANVAVDELFFLDNSTVVAVTHGRGMFKTTVSATPAMLSGHVRDLTTNEGINNATISLSPTTVSATTDSSGFYAASVPPGTYTSTASATSYVAAAVTGVVLSAGATTMQDFTLAVNQAECLFGISPTASVFGSGASGSAVAITARAGCNWTVPNPPVWASTTSGVSGSGNESWQYTVAVNATGLTRSHVVSVAGQSFTLTQLGAPLKRLTPGTFSTFTLDNAVGENRSSIEIVAGRSYCVQLAPAATEVTRSTPTLEVRRSDDTTVLGATAVGGSCFIAPASETAVLRVVQADLTARKYRLRAVETTLWANWFFVGGDYSSYTLLRNTTDVAVSATITWRSDAGDIVASQNVVVSPGYVVFRDARGLTGHASAGSVEVAHDAEPTPFVGSQTTLSATTDSPSTRS